MKGSDGFVQGYNAQAAVEPALQLIVGQSVTSSANDKEQIEPMVQAIEQQSGQRLAGILADSGYCSEKNLAYLAATGQSGYPIEAYIATGKQKHDEYREPCSRGPLPRNATRVERMKRKLQTRLGGQSMRHAKPSWSRSSARSNRPAGFASSSCAAWLKSGASGRWSVLPTTF